MYLKTVYYVLEQVQAQNIVKKHIDRLDYSSLATFYYIYINTPFKNKINNSASSFTF